MDFATRYVSQNFINEMLNTVLVRTDAPKEPSCSICGQTYGEADENTLDEINPAHVVFPGLTMTDGFVQETVEPVVVKCGHTFCTLCICLWLCNKPTCPLCRARLFEPQSHDQPVSLDDSDDDIDDSATSYGIDGYLDDDLDAVLDDALDADLDADFDDFDGSDFHEGDPVDGLHQMRWSAFVWCIISVLLSYRALREEL